MLQAVTFAHTDVLPSWFANVIARSLGLLAHGFAVTRVDATHIQIVASADAGAAIIAIGGHFRYMETTVGPAAHPGGAAGVYPAFVTAKADVIVNTPVPYTDNTDYSFGMRLLAPGATPAIVPGTVDFYRHVADVVWDGAQIVTVRQIVPTRQTWPGELPVGAQVLYCGYGDPGPGEWMIADGRLISSAAYATFDALCGRSAPATNLHAYNAGVDPGSGLVRIPDKRGKHSLGAIDMGSTAGAGPTGNANYQGSGLARSGKPGDAGGEVSHVLQPAESGVNGNGGTGNDSPDHTHLLPYTTPGSIGAWAGAVAAGGTGTAEFPGTNNSFTRSYGATNGASARHAHSLTARIADSSHNNVGPFQSDAVIVRVA